MSQVDLSLTVDPFRLASYGHSLKGSLLLCDLPRLACCVQDTTGTVTFCLDFKKQADGRDKIFGRVQASLRLICQRCLEPFDYGLDASFEAWLAKDEAEIALFPGLDDVIVVDGDVLHILELIEDELLLDVPFAPLHADLAACKFLHGEIGDMQSNAHGQNREHPFSVLQALKSQKDE